MKVNGALSTLGYIVLGIIIAYSVNVALSFALGTDMPVVAVESNSMVPTFSRGDILLLGNVPASELKIGDVIVYSPSENSVPIVHRIIAKNIDGSVQTKGDANTAQFEFEKHVTQSQIHGMVIGILPYAGWIKIAVANYIAPNIIWITVALVAAFAIMRAPRYIKSTDKI